jgi:LPXTG-motif cell wall-anchored protein
MLKDPSTLRRFAATGAFAAAVVLGAGTAGAQDQHSGGVSPNVDARDAGAPQTEVASTSSSRGLPVTGSDVEGLTIIGVAAIAAGAGAVAISRRRTEPSA